MLLEADWALPVDGAPIAGGAVLVLDGVIEDVGPAAELRARYPDATVQTYPGSVLMPGLVNTHTHLDYSAFLGFAPPGEFGGWMRRLLLSRRQLDPGDYAASALWGAHECVRSGVTCIGDTSFEGWTVAHAAGSAGLRARVYLEVFGLDDIDLPTTLAGLEARLDALRNECRQVGGSLEAGISPHAPYTVSPKLYGEIARLADRSGLRVATHVAESPAEVEFLDRGTGAIPDAYRAVDLWKGRNFKPPQVSPVEYLAGTGILGPRTLAIHCVQVDDGDMVLLADYCATVAHCPRSNMRLQCGSAPVAALLGAGVTVGLGTDSLSSNESLDMFAEMRSALMASRARASGGAPPGTTTSELTPASILRMATLDGARALGWDDLIGSLNKGKRADLISVRLPAPSSLSGGGQGVPLRGSDVVEHLVSCATASDVGMVMIDGRVVFETPSAEHARPGGRERSSVTDMEELRRDFAAVRAKLGLEDL